MKQRIKTRIQLSKDWVGKIPTLSRNQILLIIILAYDGPKKDLLKKVYYYKNNRLKYDFKIISEYNIPNVNTKDKISKEKILPYFQIKTETFLKIMALDELPTKDELLIFMWLMDRYVIKQTRSYKLKVSEVLKSIFPNYSNPSNKRKILEATLQKFKSFEYEKSGDCLIKDFKIESGWIILELDPKKRKRTKYFYRNKRR